jgi:hypothetical protein
MLRLELTFLYLASGGGCFRWRDEDSSYLQSEHDAPLKPHSVGCTVSFVSDQGRLRRAPGFR